MPTQTLAESETIQLLNLQNKIEHISNALRHPFYKAELEVAQWCLDISYREKCDILHLNRDCLHAASDRLIIQKWARDLQRDYFDEMEAHVKALDEMDRENNKQIERKEDLGEDDPWYRQRIEVWGLIWGLRDGIMMDVQSSFVDVVD